MTVSLRQGKEGRVFSGHPWVFLSDIDKASPDAKPGDVVSVLSRRGQFLAKAVYNPQSQIALRILSLKDEPIDEAFIRSRVVRAVDYRRRFADLGSCRLIHAEADGLPAVIADSFGPVISLQCLSLGMARLQPLIVDTLRELLKPEGIYERNDVPVRRLEGLEEQTGLLYGQVPDRVEILENGIRFLVDVKGGQKTGFFLDQKENRAAIAPYCSGARVLDCFTHTGSFALHAARYGADEVTAVDISEQACAVARENAQLNGLAQVRVEAANVFDYLHDAIQQGQQYDVIILDPPAFAKAKAKVDSALRGYKEINLRAMQLLRDGGYLVSCSCSQHVLPAMFRDMLLQAARDAGVSILQSEFRTQGRDHPILPAAIETQYLKCGIYRVDK